MSDKLRVTIWNEFRHEKRDESVKKIYPDGLHAPIADYLRQHDIDVTIATLDDPEHGLTEDVLDNSDILLWWGHMAHGEVSDEIVERVQQHVLAGMGFIPLHSAHFSKPFIRLMGTACTLRWRSAGEKERIWVVEPDHPIAAGLGEFIEIPRAEMYGERFDIPAPDTLVFISWFAGGEVFRSGCCYQRGRGKIFYFRPGDQEYPIYHQEEVKRVILNAVRWARPQNGKEPPTITNVREPLEKITF